MGVLFPFVFGLKAICGRSGLYFEYIGKMLRLLFVPGCDIERLKTRLLTDLKLLPSMKNLIDKSELISKLQTLEGLTNDERSNLIGLLRQHKKYGLVHTLYYVQMFIYMIITISAIVYAFRKKNDVSRQNLRYMLACESIPVLTFFIV